MSFFYLLVKLEEITQRFLATSCFVQMMVVGFARCLFGIIGFFLTCFMIRTVIVMISGNASEHESSFDCYSLYLYMSSRRVVIARKPEGLTWQSQDLTAGRKRTVRNHASARTEAVKVYNRLEPPLPWQLISPAAASGFSHTHTAPDQI